MVGIRNDALLHQKFLANLTLKLAIHTKNILNLFRVVLCNYIPKIHLLLLHEVVVVRLILQKLKSKTRILTEYFISDSFFDTYILVHNSFKCIDLSLKRC